MRGFVYSKFDDGIGACSEFSMDLEITKLWVRKLILLFCLTIRNRISERALRINKALIDRVFHFNSFCLEQMIIVDVDLQLVTVLTMTTAC